MILGDSTQVQASTYTTAKNIRGRWYQYQGSYGYLVMNICAHSVSTYHESLARKIDSYRVYAPHMNGWHQLAIKIVKKGRKGSHNVYWLNSKSKYDYLSIPQVWSAHLYIFGKKTHVLKTYYNGGNFQVYLHQKMRHSYDYTRIKHWEYFLGR
ncbi:hypothetical protein YK48G_18870 [Lentilactobacillus fungorum]|uniref:Uncharacterized protein n=2 Tax=Lentilactobacillus fungorum TaxID=2201250 RepID=A0ABQ3W1Z3_9LACO|nr:hypothetical protein YK48G_18870 [Lentilactobacillus fungorum]